MRPTASAPLWVNHRLPSGPWTMLLTPLAGAGNSVTTPLAVMRAIWLDPGCVNHMSLCGPFAIPRGLLLGVMPLKNSVLDGAGLRMAAAATVRLGMAEFEPPAHAATPLASAIPAAAVDR